MALPEACRGPYQIRMPGAMFGYHTIPECAARFVDGDRYYGLWRPALNMVYAGRHQRGAYAAHEKGSFLRVVFHAGEH